MSELIDRDVVLDVPCPGCGYKIKQSIRRLEQNPTFTCPGCKATINFNGDEIRAGFQKIENAMKSTATRIDTSAARVSTDNARVSTDGVRFTTSTKFKH
jgi:predicted RNA-binding Zn-ribbon protein involved in translation (DUF1610 family)